MGANSLGSIYDYWPTTLSYVCVCMFVCYYVNCLEIHHHVPPPQIYAVYEATTRLHHECVSSESVTAPNSSTDTNRRPYATAGWSGLRVYDTAYCYTLRGYRRPPGGHRLRHRLIVAVIWWRTRSDHSIVCENVPKCVSE